VVEAAIVSLIVDVAIGASLLSSALGGGTRVFGVATVLCSAMLGYGAHVFTHAAYDWVERRFVQGNTMFLGGFILGFTSTIGAMILSVAWVAGPRLLLVLIIVELVVTAVIAVAMWMDAVKQYRRHTVKHK
jgi:hypothetical protein